MARNARSRRDPGERKRPTRRAAVLPSGTKSGTPSSTGKGSYSPSTRSLRADLYASDPDRELEREADYFSSVLLVPPRWLRKDVDAGMRPSDLARRYQVSPDVIFIALDQHRLLHRIV